MMEGGLNSSPFLFVRSEHYDAAKVSQKERRTKESEWFG